MGALKKVYLLCMIFFACSEEDFDRHDFRDDLTIQTINGTWKVISYEDFIANTVTTKNDDNSWGFDVIITFDDIVTPHEISGRNTTNTVFGEFSYRPVRTFELHRLGTTKVGQPEWGDEFSRALLDGIIEFKVNTSNLRIYYYGKNRSVTLIKE